MKKAYIAFIEGLKEISYLIDLNFMSDEIKPLLKPVQRTVKDVSNMINDSAWGHLAVQKEDRLNGPPHFNGQVTKMQTRNGSTYPPGVSDPSGAMIGGGASTGYITPLPATPLSAALGPAALATVPVIPAVPPLPAPSTSYYGNGVGLDRSRSVSRRRL